MFTPMRLPIPILSLFLLLSPFRLCLSPFRLCLSPFRLCPSPFRLCPSRSIRPSRLCTPRMVASTIRARRSRLSSRLPLRR